MNKLANVEDIYTLSPVQEGVLFHTLYAATPSMYTSQMSFMVKGALSISAFHEAWKIAMQRHSTLRTAVIYDHGQKPLQVVYRHVDLPIVALDWRSLPPEELQQHLPKLLQEDYERGFSLPKPPLMRVTLIVLAEEQYQVIWTAHHIILDGWSRALLIQELFEFYHAYCQGSSPFNKQHYPYRNYIAWLQQNPASAEEFWSTFLKGKAAPTTLASHIFHKPEPAQAQQSALEQRDVPADIRLQLRALAGQYQVTINTIIQGAWALLLSAYTQEQDVLFGVTVSGRPASLPGIESMVGLFINTLPLRIQVQHDRMLSSWLQEIFALQGQLLHYQHSSLVDVRRWSDIPRDHPLFESILIFNNYPTDLAADQKINNLYIQDLHFHEHNNYPLCITIAPGPTLQLSAAYDPHQFAATQVQHILDHFLALLIDIATRPDKQLWQYSLLTASERQNLLGEWNKTQVALSFKGSCQQLFEQQAARTPDAIALVCMQEQLTYDYLNRRANQYAHYLLQSGVGSETVVALIAQRNLHFWMAVLAIFKAGGVYLPLDYYDSPRRIAEVLKQSAAKLVLTTAEFLPKLEEASQHLPDHSIPSVVFHELECSKLPEHNPPPLSTTRNLAYILYTSGSTGQPKGVMVEQCGMINHLYAKITDLQLSAEDCLAQNGSQSFDVSLWQFFAPLIVGGRVHILKDEIALDPLRLLQQTEEQAISLLQVVPSLLRRMLDVIGAKLYKPDFKALRWIIPTGEALPTLLCKQWLQNYPGIPLLNTYGSTECSDDQCHYPVPLLHPHNENLPIMSIGYPIPNMRMYVLNENLQPVPVGVAGELYIAGVGVGRGYYNSPAQTAEVFVPHPFAATSGERLYKTGDIVRWRTDGSLAFLRRVNYQIKLHGIRIEPGEIEMQLSQHPLVKETTVMIREDTPGDQRLVAYVVLQKQALSNAQDIESTLRDFLRHELPNWKIPSHFVLLEALPLNANGKLDRRALPPVEAVAAVPLDPYEGPRTAVEEIVARCFAGILGIENVSIHTNFFDLGGHSLLATQLISRICHTFQTDIPFHVFFDYPTVAGVAKLLQSYEAVPGQMEKIATALKTIQSMSAEEKRRLLEQKRKEGAR